MFSIAVEAAQYALSAGAADIDDVLLNTAGALVMFGLTRIKCVRKYFSGTAASGI